MPPPGKKRKFDPSFVINGNVLKVGEASSIFETSKPSPSGCKNNNMPIMEAQAMNRSFGFNKNILYEYINQPEKHEKRIIFQNEQCTIIYDCYPKAKVHLLLLPNTNFLPKVKCIRDLKEVHATKLKTLHNLARQFIEEITTNPNNHDNNDTVVKNESDKSSSLLSEQIKDDLKQIMPTSSSFVMGYHAIPSLHPLHLHIITNDFVSPYMKTKKHWNSFTTKYFVSAEDIEMWLDRGDAVEDNLPSEEIIASYLKLSLTCPKCNRVLSNMPALTSHIKDHFTEIEV